MKHLRKFFLPLAFAAVLVGCSASQTPSTQPPPTTTTTVQQTEAQVWAKAVDYFGTIETARHTANQIALTLSRANPPKMPVSVLTSFVKVDQWTIQANKLLQASPNVFNQYIATQVTLIAGQILAELTQWNSAASANPQLANLLTTMETAAYSARGLK